MVADRGIALGELAGLLPALALDDLGRGLGGSRAGVGGCGGVGVCAGVCAGEDPDGGLAREGEERRGRRGRERGES